MTPPLAALVLMPAVVALAIPSDPNAVAFMIGVVGVALIGVIERGIRQFGKAMAQYKRDQIEAEAGTHLATLGQLRAEHDLLRHQHEDCERQRAHLEAEVREVKDELHEAKKEFREDRDRFTAEFDRIKRDMFDFATDVLVAKNWIAEGSHAGDRAEGAPG